MSDAAPPELTAEERDMVTAIHATMAAAERYRVALGRLISAHDDDGALGRSFHRCQVLASEAKP